ncbi:nitrogen regulatory protein P-II family [Nitrosospira sp. Nsp5]|uniref:Nitrogen regulatory protein P-II family n=1 Tax=Nitrosospira multiformis TaxID=1231 RepID=A0ABY0TAG9_9PROT|nr:MULTISPECIES: transcriptional regulator [Nitrosospira]PTR08474.1 nitrogen regulatory protein P-II family [Nitrosospira sp. Nsp5]SDQ52897.1 nitrogen regulatory protein P-II family [Nitrosospira multiformis]
MNATITLKRLEIVIDEEKLEELINILNDVGVRGYTFIKQAGGLGSRGTRRPDDIFFEQTNAMFILACEEKQAERLVTALRPRLKEFGGMCLISDCEWVIGPAASY